MFKTVGNHYEKLNAAIATHRAKQNETEISEFDKETKRILRNTAIGIGVCLVAGVALGVLGAIVDATAELED